MPRKSHRRRHRKKETEKLQAPVGYSKLLALELQEELRQESNRQHIEKALEGRRAPKEKEIIERLKRK